MAIIGEELEGYVAKQINRRQSLHGSGGRMGFPQCQVLKVSM
jgi:hypothetical protein